MATKHKRLEFQENNKGFQAITSTLYWQSTVPMMYNIQRPYIAYASFTHILHIKHTEISQLLQNLP